MTDKEMEDRFFFRPKKRKPEVLLQDVFKAVKPTILLLSIETKNSRWDSNRLAKMQEIKRLDAYNFFHLTKPFTGLTKKEAKDLWKEWENIKKHREERKYKNKIQFTGNPGRIWPLPSSKYKEIAMRIWERAGRPTFGRHRLDEIVFGDATTLSSNYVNGKSYSNQVIITRTVGVKPFRLIRGQWKLLPCLDVDGENRLKNKRR
jgi:hypothetical protein